MQETQTNIANWPSTQQMNTTPLGHSSQHTRGTKQTPTIRSAHVLARSRSDSGSHPFQAPLTRHGDFAIVFASQTHVAVAVAVAVAVPVPEQSQ